MLHFVLPAFNEEVNIPRLLADLVPRARQLNARIIIVDDGSTDGTCQAIESHRQGYPVTVVRHLENQGVGRGVDSGIRVALMDADDDDAIVTLEADGTTDLDDLPAMLERFEEGYDVVLASFHAPGGSLLGVSWLRTTLSRTLAACLRVLSHLNEVHTFSYLFRAYRARSLRRAVEIHGHPLTREPGFPAAVELLLRLSRVDVTIAEIPSTIDWTRRQGQSKLRVFPTLLAYCRLALSHLLDAVHPRLQLPLTKDVVKTKVEVLGGPVSDAARGSDAIMTNAPTR